MAHSLGDIVSAALHRADAATKVASLRDAPIQDRSFARVDDYLARELGQLQPQQPQQGGTSKTAAAQPKPSKALDDVRLAHKYAEALFYGAAVVEKLAGPDSGPSGPVAIHKQPFENARTVAPSPQASAHARAAQANAKLVDGMPENDEDMQINEGPVIPPGYKTSRVPTTGAQSKSAARLPQKAKGMWGRTKQLLSGGHLDDLAKVNKGRRTGRAASAMDSEMKKVLGTRAGVGVAGAGGLGAVVGAGENAADGKTGLAAANAARILNAKIAQHRMLVSLGQIDAANAVLKEASDLIQGDSYSATGFPSNEDVAKLTKAQARDANQRQAGNYFGEPVKRDNAVAAHSASAQGLKLSAKRPSKKELGLVARLGQGTGVNITRGLENLANSQAKGKSWYGKKMKGVAKTLSDFNSEGNLGKIRAIGHTANAAALTGAGVAGERMMRDKGASLAKRAQRKLAKSKQQTMLGGLHKGITEFGGALAGHVNDGTNWVGRNVAKATKSTSKYVKDPKNHSTLGYGALAAGGGGAYLALRNREPNMNIYNGM